MIGYVLQLHTGFEMRTPILDLFLVYENSTSFWSVTFSFVPPAMYRYVAMLCGTLLVSRIKNMIQETKLFDLGQFNLGFTFGYNGV